jgi:hypothetical protein
MKDGIGSIHTDIKNRSGLAVARRSMDHKTIGRLFQERSTLDWDYQRGTEWCQL